MFTLFHQGGVSAGACELPVAVRAGTNARDRMSRAGLLGERGTRELGNATKHRRDVFVCYAVVAGASACASGAARLNASSLVQVASIAAIVGYGDNDTSKRRAL
jgi:hypothetical protein